ncbi:MAG: toll/interleukin-1 receptor domain-containing protein [Algisphaera sp.]
MPRVFMIYSQVDADIANAIGATLNDLGVKYFRDVKNIEWGDRIETEVQTALEDSDAILLIVSPASLKSVWVPYEIGYFSALKRPMLPFLTHPSLDLPSYISALKHVGSIDDLSTYFARMKIECKSRPSPTSAAYPDIRVRYSPMITKNSFGGLTTLVVFVVENHDPNPVFMNNVSLLLDDGRRMQITHDGITGHPVLRQELRPGQKMDVHIARDAFDSDSIRPEKVVGVVVTDDIGRQFHGDPNRLQETIQELFRGDGGK